MENEHLIQKYHSGNLSDAEQQQFDDLLKTNPEFATAVAEYENMHAAIASHEKAALKSQLQQFEATQNTTKPAKNYKRLAIAIAVILFFGLIGNYFIQQANIHETLYVAYFEPYPNALEPVTRGQNSTSLISNAMKAYEDGNYEKTIETLDIIQAGLDNPSTEISFYKAMSFLNLGEENQALAILREIKHRETKFTPQIYWYGALIHIKLKENEKALKALEYLDEIQTTYKTKEREVLKAKLR